MTPARWARSPHVLWRRVGTEIMALPLEGKPFVLAGSGAALWEALATPVAPTECARILAERHGVAVEVVADALEPVMAELLRRGVVEEV